jgi:tetratricopeptide (TPR) repeat protein
MTPISKLRRALFPILLLGLSGGLVAGCGEKTDPRILEAYELVKANRIDEALALANTVLADDPDNAPAFNLRGLAYYKSGRLEESIQEYRRALEIDPDYPEAHFNLGNSVWTMDAVDEAEREFATAVELQKDFVLARYNLGKMYQESGRIEQALAQFRQCVDYDDQFRPAFIDIGKILYGSGDFDGAVQSFGRFVELYPASKEIRVYLGNSYLQSSDPNRLPNAEKEFRAAVGIDPEYLEGVYALGTILALQNRREEAIDWYTQALDLAAPEDEAITQAILAYFEKVGHTPEGSESSPEAEESSTG